MGALEFFVAVLIAAMVFLQRRQGLLRSAALSFSVLLAGLLSFNFWEPLAAALGQAWPPIDPYADALLLMGLFLLALVPLWLMTARVLSQEVYFPRLVQHGGGAAAGILTGYLLAGFLLTVVQTLPFPRHFLDRPLDRETGQLRADLDWLSFVHRTTGQVLDNPRERWFDADGSFVHRYARYRRAVAGNAAVPRNQGEFDPVIGIRLTEMSSAE